MNNNSNVKILNHALFGAVRFYKDSDGAYKPLTKDILSILKLKNYKDDLSHLLDNKKLLKLINEANVSYEPILKDWLFNQGLNLFNDTPKLNYIYKNIYDVALSITEDDFIEIPIHPISNNEMYTYNNQKKRVTSDFYRNWKDNFPYDLLKSFKNIDFNRPIFAIYQYDQLESYDTENFNKATSDAIAHYFITDDHQIRYTYSECRNIVKKRSDGKIRIFLCNVEAGL